MASRRVPADPRGVGGAWTRFQRHDFPGPSADLAPFVARYWIVEWEYGEPYRQLIVPSPQVHVSFRDDLPPEVHGVASGHGFKELSGRGRVLGVAFRPGGGRPVLRVPISTLSDRSVPASGLPALAVWPGGEPDVASVEEWLRRSVPEADPTAQWVTEVVATVVVDPDITRVDQLASCSGTSVRRLQRLFAAYVGVSPKWVIRRYRLQEVTERMARGDTADWAGLAAELGYADQAHFTRDFTGVFGETPAQYARRY